MTTLCIGLHRPCQSVAALCTSGLVAIDAGHRRSVARYLQVLTQRGRFRYHYANKASHFRCRGTVKRRAIRSWSRHGPNIELSACWPYRWVTLPMGGQNSHPRYVAKTCPRKEKEPPNGRSEYTARRPK